MEIKTDACVCVDEWTAGNKREERFQNFTGDKGAHRTHTVVAV